MGSSDISAVLDEDSLHIKYVLKHLFLDIVDTRVFEVLVVFIGHICKLQPATDRARLVSHR